MPRNSRGRRALVRGHEVSTRNLRFSERQIAFIPTKAAAARPQRYDLLPDRSESAGPSYRPGRPLHEQVGIQAAAKGRLVDMGQKVERGGLKQDPRHIMEL